MWPVESSFSYTQVCNILPGYFLEVGSTIISIITCYIYVHFNTIILFEGFSKRSIVICGTSKQREDVTFIRDMSHERETLGRDSDKRNSTWRAQRPGTQRERKCCCVPPALKCLRGGLEFKFKVPSWYLFLQGALDEDKGPFTKIPGHLLEVPWAQRVPSRGTFYIRYFQGTFSTRYPRWG